MIIAIVFVVSVFSGCNHKNKEKAVTVADKNKAESTIG
jgi:hypothetical protein